MGPSRLRQLAALAAMAAGLLNHGGAEAQTPEVALGTFTDWQVIRYQEDGARVCAMWSDPTAATSLPGRAEPHAFVAHRPGARSYHEVSIQFGVSLQKNSTVTGTIGNQTFKLYTDGDGAWNPTSAEDLRMVKAMRGGADLTLAGRAADGKPIEDVYSLSGFTAAHQALNKACDARY